MPLPTKDGMHLTMNLHHLIRSENGGIAEMTKSFHQKNTKIIHINPNTIESGIDRAAFDKWRQTYWKERAKDFEKGGIK